MNKLRIILFWLLVSAYALLSLSFSSIKLSQVKCNEIVVNVKDNTKHLFVESKDIIELFGKRNIKLLEENLDDLDLNELEQLVIEIPTIKNAQVYKTIEGKLVIEIEQRNPIIRIINYDNESYYIDEQGAVMPLSNNYTAHVLVANGHINEPYSKVFTPDVTSLTDEDELGRKYIISELFVLAGFIHKNPFWKAQIEQIYVNENGDFELIPRIGMQTIIFGNTDNYYKKFRKLELLYKNGFPLKGWNRYNTINLKYNNQVVCTKN